MTLGPSAWLVEVGESAQDKPSPPLARLCPLDASRLSPGSTSLRCPQGGAGAGPWLCSGSCVDAVSAGTTHVDSSVLDTDMSESGHGCLWPLPSCQAPGTPVPCGGGASGDRLCRAGSRAAGDALCAVFQSTSSRSSGRSSSAHTAASQPCTSASSSATCAPTQASGPTPARSAGRSSPGGST